MDNKTKEVLSNAGLECLIPKFIDEFIGYDDLLGLTPDLIKELTPKIGFRSRLSIIIDKIKCNQRKEGEGSALTSTSSSSQGGSSISDDQLPENLPNETRESSSVSTASTVILNTAESENLVTNDSLERCPAFCYKSLVKLDLEALLKGNLVGCKLLQNCRGKSLKLKDRPFLSRLIIDNVLLQTRELKADDFIVLVNQIKRIFPGECEESYFIPSSKRGKHSLGLLPNHYRFMKRKLNDGKVLDEKTQEENAEELKITDEYLDKANWLKVNCDIGEVTSVWKETSSIRVKLLQESKGKTISEIIEEWPALKHTFGINLICIDFNTLYPNKGEKLIASWDVISHKLLGYMRENLTDFSTQLLLDSLSTCTDDARNFVIFKVIHKLFPPTVSVAPQKKRKYHPSVSESVESFILHLEIRIIDKQQRKTYSLVELTIYKDDGSVGRPYSKELLAVWKENENPNQLENLNVILPKSNQFSLKGRTLSAVVVDNWPFFGLSKDALGRFITSGIDANILKSLERRFNFTSRIIALGITEASISGAIIKRVASEQVDILIDETTITADRELVIDFTNPYYFEPTVILSLGPHEASKAWAVFTVFSKEVWFVLILSIPFYGFLLWFIRHFFISKPEMGANKGVLGFIICSLQYILGQEATIVRSWSLRFMIISYSLVGFLAHAIYSGFLTGALVAPSFEKPIDSLEDLIQSKTINIVIRKGISIQDLLQTSTTGIYKELKDKLLKSPHSYANTSDESLKLVLQGGYVTLRARLGVEILRAKLPVNLHLSRESFYPQAYGMALNRGTKLLEAFNRHLASLLEAGIVTKWKDEQVDLARKMRPKTSRIADMDPKEDILMTLTLTHLQGAFFLYLSGIVLSFIIFSLELCSKKLRFVK